MVSYRPGPARPLKWTGLNHRSARIALVKLDGIGDFVLATTFLQIFKNQAAGVHVTLFCRRRVGSVFVGCNF